MNIVVLSIHIPLSTVQTVLAETLTLDEDSVALGPGHLIVSDVDIDVSLGEDCTGAPGSGDASTIKVVVGDVDVGIGAAAQRQESMITLEDVNNKVELNYFYQYQ